MNMMGASKRIMELFLMRRSMEIPISTARFANVAFSDGSLLYGFNRRMEKNQPLSAPDDVKRYFVTPKEAGELCLMSALLGENRDIFFPKLDYGLNIITFSAIAEKYLEYKYPVYFFQSDTTGEKAFEEFYTEKETLDMERFQTVGVIKNDPAYDEKLLKYFSDTIAEYRECGDWCRKDLVKLFLEVLPEFHHMDTGKFLDGRM